MTNPKQKPFKDIRDSNGIWIGRDNFYERSGMYSVRGVINLGWGEGVPSRIDYTWYCSATYEDVLICPFPLIKVLAFVQKERR